MKLHLLGIDLGKTVFHLMGLESTGKVVIRKKCSRRQLLAFTANLEMWDLLAVMRRNVYHPAFAGSFSLKAVLPAFLPKMTYDALEVSDRKAAGLAWARFVDRTTPLVGKKSP